VNVQYIERQQRCYCQDAKSHDEPIHDSHVANRVARSKKEQNTQHKSEPTQLSHHEEQQGGYFSLGRAEEDAHEKRLAAEYKQQTCCPATLPDACVNQFYSFKVTTTGGLAPVFVGLSSFSGDWPLYFDQSTQTFTGTPFFADTFTGVVQALDSAGSQQSQNVSLTVRSCP
jgi:hypothetical protein